MSAYIIQTIDHGPVIQVNANDLTLQLGSDGALPNSHIWILQDAPNFVLLNNATQKYMNMQLTSSKADGDYHSPYSLFSFARQDRTMFQCIGLSLDTDQVLVVVRSFNNITFNRFEDPPLETMQWIFSEF